MGLYKSMGSVGKYAKGGKAKLKKELPLGGGWDDLTATEKQRYWRWMYNNDPKVEGRTSILSITLPMILMMQPESGKKTL
ncbi:MAG: hypothetical protein ACXABY_07345 [Candidatus Thorarchaeota archaeon]|jgi:hypothetical protein